MEGSNIRMRKILILIIRWISGAVFVFSGFVKGVDPAGSAIKFNDYFTAFGLGFMLPYSEALALLLILAEYMAGICLILGIRVREAAWAALLFMAAFLPFTLYLAIFNPVSDCGCFGDALVLTNWETFLKNLIITVPVLLAFLTRKETLWNWSVLNEGILFTASLALMLGVSLHSLSHLPLIDFRPYHIGANLPEKMSIPDGAPADEYETILVYEKDGVKSEFSLDNYPWQDSTWTWVETRSVLISEGYKPPIEDFTIMDLGGNDLTQDLLNNQGYVFLLISHDLSKAPDEVLLMADSLYWMAVAEGHTFLAVTSSQITDIQGAKKGLELDYTFALADETLLKTIVRSNPGLILLKEGTVINKWSHRDFDFDANRMDLLLADSLNALRKTNDVWISLSLFAGLFIVALALRFRQISKSSS